jgi:hypothetical protein
MLLFQPLTSKPCSRPGQPVHHTVKPIAAQGSRARKPCRAVSSRIRDPERRWRTDPHARWGLPLNYYDPEDDYTRTKWRIFGISVDE